MKNEMNCGIFSELISAYLDGELEASVSEKVKSHMESCSECRKYYKKLLKLSSDISLCRDEPPHDLHGYIMKSVNAEIKKSREKNKKSFAARVRRMGLVCGASLAAAICLFTVGSPLLRGGFDKMSAEGDVGIPEAYYAEETNASGDKAADIVIYSQSSTQDGRETASDASVPERAMSVLDKSEEYALTESASECVTDNFSESVCDAEINYTSVQSCVSERNVYLGYMFLPRDVLSP